MSKLHTEISSNNIDSGMNALVNVSAVLLENFKYTDIVQQVVDKVLEELLKIHPRYKIIVLSLIDDENIFLKRVSITSTAEAKIALKETEVDFHKIIIPLNELNNLAVRSIIEDRAFVTTKMWDVLRPVLREDNADKIQEVTGIKSTFVFPISIQDKVIGTMFFSTNEEYSDISESELELIRSLAVIVGISIQNAKLFEKNVKYQNSLEEALAQIQEARRKERDMMDVMGHELRTPMTIVRNALAMLDRERIKHGNVEPAKLQDYLQKGLDAARREITLIETLLSATKVDASRLQLNLEKVSVNKLIQDGIEGHKALIVDKKLEVVYTPSEPEQFIYADSVRSHEIVDNFISNAVKYTPEGKIFITNWESNGKIWVEVRDTGMGIDQKDLENLGKKFFRAKQHIKGKDIVRPGGTGLGLYVTFELIRIQNGELYVNSEVGKGTSFTFGLPTYTGQQSNQYDQTFDAGQAENRQHIFLNRLPPSAASGL